MSPGQSPCDVQVGARRAMNAVMHVGRRHRECPPHREVSGRAAYCGRPHFDSGSKSAPARAGHPLPESGGWRSACAGGAPARPTAEQGLHGLVNVLGVEAEDLGAVAVGGQFAGGNASAEGLDADLGALGRLGKGFVRLGRKTPKAPGTCYTVTLTTTEGSALTASFRLK